MNDELLKKARHYSKEHHTTLNQLIRSQLERLVGGEIDPLQAFIHDAESSTGDSKQRRWSRDELYDV